MDDVHVVTCFLLWRRPDGDRVLLARRSGQVGTYQGRWGAISGYVEASPCDQALTEIREETGLSGDGVRVLCVGSPLPIVDAALDRRWIVHPFLVEVLSPTAIALDREHTEARWVRPADVGTMATVPRLADTLAAVYPPPVASALAGGSTQRP